VNFDSNRHNGKVLCVGRVYSDLVFSDMAKIPRPGEEVFAGRLSIHAGGGAFITGAYLVAAGLRTGLCAILPSGPFAQAIAGDVKGAGLDLSHCQSAANDVDPQITVAMALASERAFLTRRSGPSVPKTIDYALDDPALRHLHIAELATLFDNPDLVARARQRGLSVSLDCSWDEEVISAEGAHLLFEGIDLFLPNEKEIRTLLNIEGELEKAGKQISALAGMVAVKQGRAGAMLFAKTRVIRTPALAAHVIDTTGAGDAFNAGFISAWLDGASKKECLDRGNQYGAEAVKYAGGASGAVTVFQRRPGDERQKIL